MWPGHDLLAGHAVGEHAEHFRDRDPEPADARDAAHLAGVHRDAIHGVNATRSVRLRQLWFEVLSADVCWLVLADAVGAAGYSRDEALKLPRNPHRHWVFLHTSNHRFA